MKAFLIFLALVVLWIPARMFEFFAAWEYKLRTANDNLQAGRERGGQ